MIFAGIVISAPPKQSGTGPVKLPRELTADLVTKIERADYLGNRDGLDTLYRELLTFIDDPEIGSRVRYWRGFAKWRRAINGANETPTPTDIVRDLADGEAEFAAALELDPTFADAKVGAASCSILRIYFEGIFSRVRDGASLRAILAPSRQLLQQVQNQVPENPRLLWVVGQNQWSIARTTADQTAAMETYGRGLTAVRNEQGHVDDPLEPRWGEPELLMNLAWASLHRTAPDLDAAEQYAKAALHLVPYWHYVRDILMPQILEAKTKTKK
jgi:hypothetical protein